MRYRTTRSCLLLFVVLVSAPVASAQTPTVTDPAFWRAVAANEFKVPTGPSMPAMLDALTGLLGSTDPVLRDDVAYSTLANWIYRQRVVSVEERRRLLGVWQLNLRAGLGEAGTPTVLRRSFSALALGTLAILDNEVPYLERSEFTSLLQAAVAYLRDEKDVRGFDSTLGWIHTVAHSADLLKFLARSRHLTRDEQALVLQAVADVVLRVETPLVHGEDERLARAVLSIAARSDLDDAAMAAFAKRVAPERRSGAPTAATLAMDGNRRHLLVALHTVLSTDRRDLPTLVRTRALVLETLRTFM
jgi:hypothetical protein